jgi:DNA-directed RNA polymerase subunit RPC12/RpoP
METRRINTKQGLITQYFCCKCKKYTNKDNWWVDSKDTSAAYECPNCGNVLKIGVNND